MSKAKFISHPDFCAVDPINVYHREIGEDGIYIPTGNNDGSVSLLHPAAMRNKHIIFRKKARLADFKKAILKITADDYYKLYVNGRFVTEGPAPSYPEAYFYNEIDVTEYLRSGEENIFAVHTYYQGLINRVWVSGDLKEMLWLSLLLDGKETLVSDESWTCKIHTGYAECGKVGYETAFMEVYDARSVDRDFYKTDFCEVDFVKAKKNKNCEWKLTRQSTRQLDIYEVSPEKTEVCDFGLRLHFATEAVGMLTFEALGNIGDEIILRYGEELCEDGSVRYDMRCNCLYEEKMILSGGRDRLMQFDYKAFRYAELHFPKSVKIENIKIRVRHYPFEKRYDYTNTDKELGAVLALCENTIKYGTQEQFLDCPTREKGAYLGDLMVSGRAHAVLTGDTAMIKHAVENFNRTAFINQGLMACSGGSFMQEIADYSLEFPAVLAWIYSIDGDIDFLKRCEPYATGVYEYYKKYENGDGLLDRVLEWNLVDWPANLRDNYDFPLTRPVEAGVHNVINALWYGLKLALAEIYSILGKSHELDTEKTKRAYTDAFYSKETGIFVDSVGSSHSAVHSNVFPLLFGITEDIPGATERVVTLIRKRRLKSMGVYMAYFALAALKKVGEYVLCHELACDKDAWLNMINEGATVTYEAWGKEQKWNTSLFHPWATAPLIIFADVRPY